MVLNYAAAWCANAVRFVEGTREALEEFNERRAETDLALRAFVGHAETDPTDGDKGLVCLGVAATLRRFEGTVLDHLSLTNFDSYKRVGSARAAFGSTSDKWTPQASDVELPAELEALASHIQELAEEISASGRGQAESFSEKSLATLLDMIQKAAPPVRPKRTELPAFYVAKEKRSDQLKVAGWTLGILFVLTSLIQGIFVLIFLGTAAYFGAQFVVTNRVDEEERSAEQDMVGYEAGLRQRVQDLNARADALLEKLLREMEYRLDETARAASKACSSMLALARGADHSEPPELNLVFGQCAVTPLIGHMSRHTDSGFLTYAMAGNLLEDFVEDSEPIGGCFAYVPLADCDEVEVVVDAEADPGAIGTSLAAAALRASKPGRARFMFIEPGRLAEAYRVFGALNESAATRLAERLYITHVNELASAVDALRTFVGRTKEATTRRADADQRIFGGGVDENSIFLQRAVVVLDATQSFHWPEKDKRRLSEYFAEVRALAQVGAREGSVLLIELTIPGKAPETRDRRVRVRAGADGLMFEGVVLVLYPATEGAARIGAECDAWVKEARKADSTLRQTGAALDWSDAEASNTRYGIEVDIGRHGADRPAKLLLGREGAHHAICIGRTGSGKTNLFHVIISNLVRRYSPEELELYLLDFKEGVEFAVYADLALPHCRAVAIDADRAFGLSVLTHLKRELNRRANVFKAAGVGIASLEKYELTTGKNMARIVLLIDEFQVLLQAGERTPGAAPGAAAAALEDLVRRGRSFGLHVILGSQTLAGRELTAATLGQLAVRIVLPCSAADAAMLLGEQPIAGQLRAPGDAIVWRAGQGDVSDAHLGKIFEANLDDLPDLAEISREHAASEGKPAPAPFVFRGSGQNELTEVMPHLEAVKRERKEADSSYFAIGAPTSFGDRPAGLLRNARARNLLFVHRDDETRASFFYAAVESLLALDPSCEAVVCDLDGATDHSNDKPMTERLLNAFNGRVHLVGAEALENEAERLVEVLRQPRRGSRTVLAIAGAGRANLARSQAFAKLLKEGSEAGVHVIATCDTVRNLERLVERSLLAEFGMRGLGPSAAGDSQKLLDASDAEALTADHHYLLFDDSVTGRLTRLQVLTPSLQRVETASMPVAEVSDA